MFGPNSSFGGEKGVQWLERYPYALPMLANFVFLSICAGLVGYGLEEVWTYSQDYFRGIRLLTVFTFQTLQACKGKPGLGSFTMKYFARSVRSVVGTRSPLYSKLPFRDADEDGPLLGHSEDRSESYELEEKAKPMRAKRVLPFGRIWTKNVLSTLLAQAFFDFQMG